MFPHFKKTFSYAFTSVGILGYYACIGHCILEYLGDFIICQGPSMEPTLISNDIVIGEHISVMRRKVKKGDIVVSRSPNDPQIYICKRVKALPGEKVGHGIMAQIVPVGHVWLEGDNKNCSTDSRVYGPVPIGLLRSRIFCRVWPFTKARVFSPR